jgi:hypothetical protein
MEIKIKDSINGEKLVVNVNYGLSYLNKYVPRTIEVIYYYMKDGIVHDNHLLTGEWYGHSHGDLDASLNVVCHITGKKFVVGPSRRTDKKREFEFTAVGMFLESVRWAYQEQRAYICGTKERENGSLTYDYDWLPNTGWKRIRAAYVRKIMPYEDKPTDLILNEVTGVRDYHFVRNVKEGNVKSRYYLVGNLDSLTDQIKNVGRWVSIPESLHPYQPRKRLL